MSNPNQRNPKTDSPPHKKPTSGKQTSSSSSAPSFPNVGFDSRSATSIQREERREEGTEIITPVSKQDMKKVFNWEQMHGLDAGPAFELVYGFKPDVVFTPEYGNTINKMNARKWWERSSATTQCDNVLGQVDFKKTKCYICGFPFVEEDANPPECEHILPVYKAAMYLTLYRGEYKDIMKKGRNDELEDINDIRIFNEINMEYAWAHRCCNQKKKDKDFIEYVEKRGNTGTFKLNYKTTESVLSEIVNVLLNGGDGLCEEKSLKKAFKSSLKTKKQIAQWITTRIDILGAKSKGKQPGGKIETIVKYLNGLPNNNNYSMFTLINLCNLISAADMTEVQTIWGKIEGLPTPVPTKASSTPLISEKPPIKNVPPVEQITKATTIMILTNDANKLCEFNWGRTKDNTEMYNLYKTIFNIPDGISISKLRRDGKNDLTTAILGSILHNDKKNPAINDFFRNFYAIITYHSITSGIVLFPDAIGKIYASNMVGQAYKILFLLIMIGNIQNSGLDLSKTPDLDFYNRFIEKLETEIVTLMNIKNNYNDKVAQPDADNYYLFLMIFVQFVDRKSKDILLPSLKKIYNSQSSKKINKDIAFSKLLVKTNPLNSTYMELISVSNIENAVVQYYMDSAQYLDFYPHWDPNVPDENDTEMTTSAKGIAIGATGLLKLLDDDVDALDFETDSLIQEIGQIYSEDPELSSGIIRTHLQSFRDISQLNELDELTLRTIILDIYKQIHINILWDYITTDFDFSKDIILSFLNNNLDTPEITEENATPDKLLELLKNLTISDLTTIIESIEGINTLSILNTSSEMSAESEEIPTESEKMPELEKIPAESEKISADESDKMPTESDKILEKGGKKTIHRRKKYKTQKKIRNKNKTIQKRKKIKKTIKKRSPRKNKKTQKNK